MDQDIDIEWDKLDNIEKQFIDTKSNDVAATSSKSSPIKKNNSLKTPIPSPDNLKNTVITPKSSPVKSVSLTPNLSPAKTPVKVVQSVLISQKTKSPSISPKQCKSERKISNITKLDFNDGEICKTSFKRKNSPTKTPENKKFKVDSVQSPDTQVRNIIIYSYCIFLCCL